MSTDYGEDLFKELWPYVKDDDVTDIKWNGTDLWITDLNKGRYLEDSVNLDEEWLKIFTGIIANEMNENFNLSKPSLMAETKDLRIQAEHSSVAGDKKICVAIRKTPTVSRLSNKNLIEEGYASEYVLKLLPCLMRARLSGVITGDVGSGKTELEKYMCSFIPDSDPIVTVEDTLELRLKSLYPNKDIYSMKISRNFTQSDAIKDALRLNTKWLIISESRGKDISYIMEGASSGCVALTSIHAENVWEIPDRIMNMAASSARQGMENDIYTFFDYAIKVKAQYSPEGVKRRIDQICFFDRNNQKNTISVVMKNSVIQRAFIPDRVIEKFIENNETEFLKEYIDSLKEFKYAENIENI